MVKAVGIDSGTKTMDIYGFDDQDGKVLIDFALSREEVTKNPSLVIDKLREIQRAAARLTRLQDLQVTVCRFKKPKTQPWKTSRWQPS